MKKILTLIFFLITINCLFCQIQNSKIEYFDELGKKITQDQYVEKIKSQKFTTIVTDTTNNVHLTQKIQAGKITNKQKFDSIISRDFGNKYNSNLPLVIIYYPGRDYCNKANNGKKWNPIKNRYYNELEKGLRKLGKHNMFYVYKSNNGLKEGNKGYKKWYSDPDGIFEKLFFKYHYPCNSYIILKPDAKYIAIYGESGKEKVWEMFQKINNL